MKQFSKMLKFWTSKFRIFTRLEETDHNSIVQECNMCCYINWLYSIILINKFTFQVETDILKNVYIIN